VIAGALVTREADDAWNRIKLLRFRRCGARAFEAWLLLRGLRTLYVRVPASAAAPCRSPAISRRIRASAPSLSGLPSDPGHAVASRQMHGGFGGMLSLRVKGGAPAALN